MDEQITASVGDELVRIGGYGRELRRVRVAGLTPKMLIVDHDERFWIKNGRRVGAGAGWDNPRVERLTPQFDERLRRQEALYALKVAHWDLLTTEDLQPIVALYEAGKAKKAQQASSERP